FSLGGDSIKAVQIASQLRNRGIGIDAKDILTYHTIEQVSRRARAHDAATRYGHHPVSGRKGLFPIDGWFFGQQFRNPGYYNQSVLLRLHGTADVQRFEKAFRVLIGHHDGLRLNYDPRQGELFYNNRHLEADFVIERYAVPAGPDALAPLPVPYAALKGSFDITGDLLLKAALIEETGGATFLFITAHHLVVDGVSWRILLEDLYACYRALEKGHTPRLPAKTAPLPEWHQALADYAQSGVPAGEEAYWQDAESTAFALPLDCQTDDWRVENRRVVTASLSREKTDFLLKEAHRPYKTDVPILLNTALALTLNAWAGPGPWVVEQENHGRHLEQVDVSRTVGWFTVMYPLKLEAAGNALGDQIQAVKERLRNVPRQGLGYGVRNYLAQPRAGHGDRLSPVRFNYLGQFGQELHNDLFSLSRKPTGTDVDPANRMTAVLELNAMVVDGGLSLEIAYNEKAHRPATVQGLMTTFLEALDQVLEHVRNEQSVYFTPSDFQAVDLDQEELDALFR
ncbi:MAG TPA: condensation domain-containing protein, partial [Cytophagales bacterium]